MNRCFTLDVDILFLVKAESPVEGLIEGHLLRFLDI